MPLVPTLLPHGVATPGEGGTALTVRQPGLWLKGTFTPGGAVGAPPSNGGTSVVMRSRTFRIGQGDRLPIIAAQLVDDSTSKPVDLTGGAVRFSMSRDETGMVVLNRVDATIVNAKLGEVEYVWADGDTAVAGSFQAEWEVTLGGKQVTFPDRGTKMVVVIAPQIA